MIVAGYRNLLIGHGGMELFLLPLSLALGVIVLRPSIHLDFQTFNLRSPGS